MVDEITQLHLDRARIRGAPATVPGSTGLVGEYPVREATRQALRALATPLQNGFCVSDLRDKSTRLAQLAAVQELRVLEQPLLALNADPGQDVPHEWQWQVLLPVRGRAKGDDEAGISVTRVHGGQYLETMTPRGLADLGNLYTFFLGDFMPRKKQQLTRPVIYHRVLDGIDSDDPRKLSLAVFIPFLLSLRSPIRLVTRQDLA